MTEEELHAKVASLVKQLERELPEEAVFLLSIGVPYGEHTKTCMGTNLDGSDVARYLQTTLDGVRREGSLHLRSSSN